MPLMSLKGRYSITCPPETAFGMKGYPPIIPPMATVIYEVELTTFTNAGTCSVHISTYCIYLTRITLKEPRSGC